MYSASSVSLVHSHPKCSEAPFLLTVAWYPFGYQAAQNTQVIVDKILWTAHFHLDNSQFHPYLVS